MSNLGNSYYQQGKYSQAETLYREALETQGRVLEAEHPDTLVSMINLASALGEQGQVCRR